jgi:hypothetical protein
VQAAKLAFDQPIDAAHFGVVVDLDVGNDAWQS